MTERISPDRIDHLDEDQVFVFGSNLAGNHGAGAAAMAMDKFGAIWGQGMGMQGKSYAIPTMHGGIEEIKPYVDEFIQFARDNRYLTFLVTRVGCGIAGFSDKEMAPLFEDAIHLDNVYLPKSFVDIILRK